MKTVWAFLLYVFVRSVVGLLGRLPWFVLHKISDALAWLLINVVQYRKKVILSNLERCFPEKTFAERVEILHRFYVHFADLLVEVIKSNYLTTEDLKKRLVGKNTEIIAHYLDNGKSAIGILGHLANWEWLANVGAVTVRQQFVGVYKPLRNQFIDKWMQKIRNRSNSILLPTYETSKWFSENQNRTFLAGFIADQSPGNPDKAIWATFFNQPTAFLPGGALLSHKYDMLYFYCSMKKTARSQYQFEYRIITDSPKDFSPEQLVQAFAQLLEADIREQPECWLWSHKRWKLQPPSAVVPQNE